MPVKSSKRKQLYQENKKQGLCPRCGNKRKKNSKFKFCDDCRAYFREYNSRNTEEINSLRKARYAERKEDNRCPRCGKKLGKKYKNTICPACLEKQYIYNNS